MNHAHPTPEHERVMADVTAERHRQISKGWTPEHDDRHTLGGMLSLAGERAGRAWGHADRLESHRRVEVRRYLIQAIALLVAAVESMDRKAARRG